VTAETSQRALRRLQRKMANCRQCLEYGHPIAPGAVFSGRFGAQVMVIGQAPGVTEVKAQRPFNAGSGSRLFQWLTGAGFDEADFRRSQYMTSVTKCFPGKARNGGGDRAPSRAEQALCRPYLEAELALIDPRLVLPVGRLAINLFFNPPQPLEELIGKEKRLDGRWIVPLPHPSGASRWHQIDANRLRIERAVSLIRAHRLELGL
jgi:uracil-DNA glycosylase family 4